MVVKILFLLLISGAVFADVMNLNEFMPTRLEDSTNIKEKNFEFQLSSDFQNEDTDQIIFRENIRYGATQRLQLDLIGNQLSGGNESGSGEIQLGGQYMILDELSVAPMFALPTGKAAEGIDSHLRFNNSFTLMGSTNTPMLQMHFNLDWGHNAQRQASERSDQYLYIAGLSYKFNDSGSLLFDILREELQNKGEESNVVELGTQYEIGSHYLLGLGGGMGFGDESPHWNGILSLIKQVGL